MDALTIAKYIVCEMNRIKEKVTQLKLQKLLYFVEAYYMVKYDKEKLFEDEFLAWTYGPVCKSVYDKYKSYYDLPIVESDCEDIKDPQIEDAIKIVCEAFGSLSTSKLIAITHLKESPWDKSEKRNSIISKQETKEWFRRLFTKNG